jgi:hypothetical protein
MLTYVAFQGWQFIVSSILQLNADKMDAVQISSVPSQDRSNKNPDPAS